MPPIISFVVPAYNVEPYIEECVNSIQKQSLKNIEIIIVDDGSKDKTPSIVDKLASYDSRIKVVHKQNEGVSEARNTGITVAEGDYLVFVDGDDFISPDYAAYMTDLIKKDDADFALSINSYSNKNESQIKEDHVRVLTPEDSLTLLLSPRVTVGCWNKIYKRSFILGKRLRFNSQLFYGEGLRFITQVAQMAERTVVGERKVYYYRRNNYASVCTKFNIQNYYNGFVSLEIIESDLLVSTPKVLEMLTFHRTMFRAGAIARILSANVEKDYWDYYQESLRFVRRNTMRCLLVRGVTIYKKCILLGICISPWLVAKLDVLRRKNIQTNSIG